jgi:hypothetical protein
MCQPRGRSLSLYRGAAGAVAIFLCTYGSYTNVLTHEEMEWHLPRLQLLCQLLCQHAHLYMPHATIAHTCRAHTHAAARHMHVDAHAGGDCTTDKRYARGDRICMRPLPTPANVATWKHFYSIHLKQVKHLRTYVCNICVYQLRPDKHICNIRLK